jgi:hypothetical protein
MLLICLHMLVEGGLRSDHDSSGEMEKRKYLVLSCTLPSVYIFLCDQPRGLVVKVSDY